MLSQIRYIDTLLMLKSIFPGESGWNCPILYNHAPQHWFGMGQGYGTSKVVLRSKTMGQSILSHIVVPLKSIGITKILPMGQDMHPLPVRERLYKTY